MNNDLHWLSFRYVCGELTADEETAFELRLADDQRAREAVAKAVELHEAIRVAAAELPGLRARCTWRRLAWMAAAACLLLATGLFWLAARTRTPDEKHIPPGAIANKESSDAANVALTWAEMRQARSEDAVAETPDAHAAPRTELPTEDVDDIEVPQWMVIAFADEARRKGKR
jgi:hypothetical protein